MRLVALPPADRGTPISLLVRHRVNRHLPAGERDPGVPGGRSTTCPNRPGDRRVDAGAGLAASKLFVADPEVGASTGTTLLIDGTSAPCWSWKEAPEPYSGKHKTTGHNPQVASDPRGRLVYLSAPGPAGRMTPRPCANSTWHGPDQHRQGATSSATRATEAADSSGDGPSDNGKHCRMEPPATAGVHNERSPSA